MPTTILKNGNSVMFEAFHPFRRRLNYTVLAYGCDEHPVMEATELSNAFNVDDIYLLPHITTLCSQVPMTFKICQSILLILV